VFTPRAYSKRQSQATHTTHGKHAGNKAGMLPIVVVVTANWDCSITGCQLTATGSVGLTVSRNLPRPCSHANADGNCTDYAGVPGSSETVKGNFDSSGHVGTTNGVLRLSHQVNSRVRAASPKFGRWQGS